MRHASRYMLMGLLILGATWASSAMAAATTLKNISYDALPGGSVELHMDFGTGPVPEPKIFTTDNPPRIAVDFADTSNAAARHLDIGKGSTSGVSAVSAGGRTRVVVELMRASSYRARVDGNSLVLTVNNGTANQSVTTASTIDPTKRLPSSSDGPDISKIDFRRGPNGEGRVLINFSGSGAQPEMTHQGDKVLVTIDHANLPADLAQRLDTLDFATPVQSIVTRAGNGGGARIEINTKGSVETSAYQTPDQYVVEVAPKKADDKAGKLAKLDKEPSYNGKRVTFNFQDIPVRSALQLIADISGLNLVASDSVGGSVTLRLVNVPWDQALDVIMRAKGLDKRKNGNVIWIAPQEQIAKYEENLAAARLKAQVQAPLVTAYIPISYGKAKDIAGLLTQKSMQSTGGGGGEGAGASRGFLSPRGSVSFDDRTNTLLINDTPDKITEIRNLVSVLDRPVKQVLIESRIVAATDNFTRQLGVKWGATARKVNDNNVLATAPTAEDAVNTAASGVANAAGFNINMPVKQPSGSFGLAILGANYLLDLELDASQSEGQTEIISSPRVITANQQEADIQQGQQIGYVTFQNSGGGAGTGTATVQFKNVVLELKVTPTITADKRVYLKINVTKDALNSFIDSPNGGKVPQIDHRSLNTSVLVDNGQTVVLGGIYEITKTDTTAKVPGLGDIPILGYLFRSKNRTNNKAELLIFVTPRILSDTGR
jgi:type IV pilus assembly protein PilQ